MCNLLQTCWKIQFLFLQVVIIKIYERPRNPCQNVKTSIFHWSQRMHSLLVSKSRLSPAVLVEPRSHYAGAIWKRRFHSENTSNVFRPHYDGEIWKRNNRPSCWICVWAKLGQISHDYRVVFVFEKLPYKMFSNSFGLKGVFEKLRFRDGLVWKVGLTVTVEIKPRF